LDLGENTPVTWESWREIITKLLQSPESAMECLFLDSNNIESMRLPTKADHKSWT
jgi:hypothetical protein